MNIGSVIRGLLGDSKPGEPRQLELQSGQVVRGTVLKVNEEGNEAVLQIQGVQVKAKLETPLQEGQTTLLQVEPQGDSNLPTLKPLSNASNVVIPAQTLGEVMEALELPNTKPNQELILAMNQSGIPLTKENAELLRGTLQFKPPSVPLDEWVQSASVALQRGLPVTGESIKGLQQTIFGPPLHQLLAALEEQLQTLNSELSAPPGKNMASAAGMSQPQPSGTASAAAAPNAAKAAAVPAAASTPLPAASVSADAAEPAPLGGHMPAPAGFPDGKVRTPAGAPDGKPNLPAGSSTGAAAVEEAEAVPLPQQPAATAAQENIPARTAGTTTSVPDGQPAAVPQPAGKPAGSASAGASAAVPVDTAEPHLPAEPSAGNRAPQPAAAAAVPAAGTLAQKVLALLQELRSAAQPPEPAAEPTAAASGRAAAAPAPPAEPWVGRVLKLLGAEHEQQSLRAAAVAAQHPQAAAVPAPPQRAAAGEAAALAASPLGDGPVEAAAQPAAPDSLKGTLLQLLGSDDVPPQLKETVQQVVQSLTGQQLLLNNDKAAPFAQMHLFVPFVGPDGEVTASVQVQSRRGKRGELDASNCRLWFDLDMKALGPTLVDVHVVDRIVTLKVHNDQEWAEALLQNGKEEIGRALSGMGYQLLSLKSLPLPERTRVQETAQSAAQAYIPDTYKGVDVKI
ncbi:DNA ligase [Paenibacillus sp. JX-17]|uniref:DNA ligase n=1 Tax=Paenibacillus lacisoli TaxID=3064525 RepID=A0ABT9C9B2_9BACL|nr:DNA ligase [Paenibacillus sp. JX-17]MDO7905853.1 DNA ligase [Paenibacillus sp. JX-17]